jgi:hypothetical protein
VHPSTKANDPFRDLLRLPLWLIPAISPVQTNQISRKLTALRIFSLNLSAFGRVRNGAVYGSFEQPTRVRRMGWGYIASVCDVRF